jgi:hypothetical protein
MKEGSDRKLILGKNHKPSWPKIKTLLSGDGEDVE